MATGDGATAWACLRLSGDYRAAWNEHAARPRYEDGAPFLLRIRCDADRIAERDWSLMAWEDPEGDAASAFFAEAPMLEGEGSAAATPLLPMVAEDWWPDGWMRGRVKRRLANARAMLKAYRDIAAGRR